MLTELSVLCLELLVVRFTRVDIRTMGDISFAAALMWLLVQRLVTRARSRAAGRVVSSPQATERKLDVTPTAWAL